MSSTITRAQRIAVLEERLEYVSNEAARRRALGDPHSFLTNERKALEWALPLLRVHVTDAAGREALRVEAARAIRVAAKAVADMRELDPDAAAADAARHEAQLPRHLRQDTPPSAQCDTCRRKSWSPEELGEPCDMPQPSGVRCTGTMRAPAVEEVGRNGG